MTREMMSKSKASRPIDTASPADLQTRFARCQQGPQDPHSHQSASISKAHVDPEEGHGSAALTGARPKAKRDRYEQHLSSYLKPQAFLTKDKIRN
jgi:hypothetical protein